MWDWRPKDQGPSCLGCLPSDFSSPPGRPIIIADVHYNVHLCPRPHESPLSHNTVGRLVRPRDECDETCLLLGGGLLIDRSIDSISAVRARGARVHTPSAPVGMSQDEQATHPTKSSQSNTPDEGHVYGQINPMVVEESFVPKKPHRRYFNKLSGPLDAREYNGPLVHPESMISNIRSEIEI